MEHTTSPAEVPATSRCQPRDSTIRGTSTTPAASASSSTSRAEEPHASSRQALQVLVNLLHRGACGCEVNTGDGAGILIQMPDRFLRKEAGASRDRAAAGARLRRRPGVPAARPGGARAGRDDLRGDRRSTRASSCSAGATCRPTTARSARAPSRSSPCSSRSSSAARRVRRRQARRSRATRSSSASSTSSASGSSTRSTRSISRRRRSASSTSSACRRTR